MSRLGFLLIFGALHLSIFLGAQQTFQPRPLTQSDSKGIVFDQEFSVDLRLQTHGFALAINRGKIKTYYKTNYYHFEIGELKHPKEFRNTFDFSRNRDGASFIFGKRNNLYVVRMGWGQKRYFSEKAKKKGLAVGASYEFGPSIGLLKPYQLKLKYINDPSTNIDDVTRIESYSEDNHEIYTDLNRISGAAGFGKGWNELKIRPGIQGKLGLHLDWGAFDEMVKAVEIGMMVDLFPKEIPILIPLEANENKAYFLNLYLTLQFGKRW